MKTMKERNYNFDLSGLVNIAAPIERYKILTCEILLSKSDVCECLKYDFVFINGVYYNTPVEQLLKTYSRQDFFTPVKYELMELISKEDEA